jgi:hypothetical protein
MPRTTLAGFHYTAPQNGGASMSLNYRSSTVADMNPQDEIRCIPLYCALYKGKLDVARLLVERGVNVDLEDD